MLVRTSPNLTQPARAGTDVSFFLCKHNATRSELRSEGHLLLGPSVPTFFVPAVPPCLPELPASPFAFPLGKLIRSSSMIPHGL